jgi:hypothetical protein
MLSYFLSSNLNFLSNLVWFFKNRRNISIHLSFNYETISIIKNRHFIFVILNCLVNLPDFVEYLKKEKNNHNLKNYRENVKFQKQKKIFEIFNCKNILLLSSFIGKDLKKNNFFFGKIRILKRELKYIRTISKYYFIN